MTTRSDVAVVGGGVIGLTTAWRCLQHGLSVSLIDAGHSPATHIAAGVLGAVTEPAATCDDLARLNATSADCYEGFCGELASVTGDDTAYRISGALLVARECDDPAALARQVFSWHATHRICGPLARPALMRLEPEIAPAFSRGFHLPDAHSVDVRKLVAALRAAVYARGGHVAATRAAGVRCEGDDVTGVDCVDGTSIESDRTIIAAGAWSTELPGLPQEAQIPVRRIKEHIVRLRDRSARGAVDRIIANSSVYLAPLSESRYLLGGSFDAEDGDLGVVAGATARLLERGAELVPLVSELELEDVSAGYRTRTPDGLPVIGPGSLNGLIWATGHDRFGVLQAPITADLVVDCVTGRVSSPLASACDPMRFARVAAS